MTEFGHASVHYRNYFSGTYLRMAERSAFAAREFEIKAAKSEAVAWPEIAVIIEFAINSVLMSVACIEAYINEIYTDAYDGYVGSELKAFHQPLKLLWMGGAERFKILDKYQVALEALSMEKIKFSDGAHQYAPRLIALRNDLMHYKPSLEPGGLRLEDEQHKFKDLQRVFKLNQVTEGKSFSYFPAKLLGAGCATWATTCARSLIEAFHKKTGIPSRNLLPPFDEAAALSLYRINPPPVAN